MTIAQATHQRWDDLPIDTPMPLIERRRIVGQHAMISHISMRKGFSIGSHHHENEQVSIVLEGCLRCGIGDPEDPDYRLIVARPGEVVLLPAHCPHSAEALEDTVLLDVFSPPSHETGIDRA